MRGHNIVIRKYKQQQQQRQQQQRTRRKTQGSQGRESPDQRLIIVASLPAVCIP